MQAPGLAAQAERAQAEAGAAFSIRLPLAAVAPEDGPLQPAPDGPGPVPALPARQSG